MSKGWISIHRELQDHWLWNDKRVFSRLEAWLDILLTVNYEEKKVMIKNVLFTVKRGQSINSQLTWSERWNWNRSKVRRFLEMLEKDKMIKLETNNKTTILTVCKYDSYQSKRTSDEHQTNIKRTSNEHQTNINNNTNNTNNINKENKKAFSFILDNKNEEVDIFIMQNKPNVFEWNDLINAFNDKMEIEVSQNKITFALQQLFPRFRSFCRNWINNQVKPKKTKDNTNIEILPNGRRNVI